MVTHLLKRAINYTIMGKVEIRTWEPDLPDELQFVDEDIKKAFEGTNYIIGTPTNVQLSRNIKKLTEVLLKTWNP